LDRLLSCGISTSKEVYVFMNLVAIRTTTGKKLHLVRDLTGLDSWCCTRRQVKKGAGEEEFGANKKSIEYYA
jgi:DNA-directed RNA polymerase subunit N (RpoN/RPB10)